MCETLFALIAPPQSDFKIAILTEDYLGAGEQGDDLMYQDLDDLIDVIVVFENHHLRPVRFRWKGHIHKVARVTGAWKSREGEHAVRHFAVVDSRANYFQLTYTERLTKWVVSKIWVE